LKKVIYLQRIGQLDKIILLKLQKNLKWSFREFSLSIKILNDEMPLGESTYNQTRRQHDASLIMRNLKSHLTGNQYFRILGMMDEDIYSSYLNFVFGIAMKPLSYSFKQSILALISITRLRESFYRREEDESLFEQRVLKEALHELGHTFSLEHCNNYCIMRFSNSLRDTDEKPPKFCDECLKKLIKFLTDLNSIT
jgi:archaemetzincin